MGLGRWRSPTPQEVPSLAEFSAAARRRFRRVGTGASVGPRYRLRLRVLEDAETRSVAAARRHVGVARSTSSGGPSATTRTHRRKFWERYDGSVDLPPLPAALREWEATDHDRRPHQACGSRTPASLREDHLERTS